MPSRFNNFVKQHEPVEGALPSTHTTDSYVLREVLETGTLSPSECPVFEERLLYLFYGRPSYRVHPDEPPNALLSYAPVCFILAPEVVETPKRIFPFDTGAFKKGMFVDSMHRKMTLKNFELETDQSVPQRLIKVFFGSNSAYMRNEPEKNVNFGSLDFEVESFFNLITDRRRNAYDDRISAIEVQLSRDLNLKSKLMAVVLPQEHADHDAVKNFLKENGAVPLLYSMVSRMRPTEFTSNIANTVVDYFAREGLI